MSCRSVIAIGVFDALHLGHQAILTHARGLADAAGARVVAMVFDPHPASVLRPGTQPPRLTTLQERQVLLQSHGVDEVVTLTPSPELFALSAEAFIQRVVKDHHPVAFVEGSNFRFGHDRQGDVQTLQDLGKRYGFEAHGLPQTQVALSDQLLATVSSSLTRWLVGCGRMVDVTRCLGRHYTLTGPIIQGEQRGRLLGVPTANLDFSDCPDKLIPADGVYAAMAELADGSTYAAAVSIGPKPTFNGQRVAVEAHLLDFSGDLYDQSLTLHMVRWVRDQQPFPNLETLKAQLGRDIDRTRQWHRQGLLSPPQAMMVKD